MITMDSFVIAGRSFRSIHDEPAIAGVRDEVHGLINRFGSRHQGTPGRHSGYSDRQHKPDGARSESPRAYAHVDHLICLEESVPEVHVDCVVLDVVNIRIDQSKGGRRERFLYRGREDTVVNAP